MTLEVALAEAREAARAHRLLTLADARRWEALVSGGDTR
jgi:hypothetical protein